MIEVDGESLGVWLRGWCNEFGDFGGQVDTDGAPGDTSAAADATAGAKLIEPGCEFMGDPLSISRADGVANGSTGGVREIGIEARVPASLANDRFIGQVVDFIDTRAEAGRADHGAVCAREAARGDIIPMGVLELF